MLGGPVSVASIQSSRGRWLAVSIGALLAWAPATAASQALPRHKPRVTDAAEDSEPASAPAAEASKKGRKTTLPVESPLAEESAAPARTSTRDRAAPRDQATGRESGGASRDPMADDLPPGFHEIPVPRKAAPPREASQPEGEFEERLSSLDEPGMGLGVEILGGLLLLSGGISSSSQFGWGLAADWQVGRLFREESFFHQNAFLELSWVHTASSYGTDDVQVAQSQNYFAASALLGTLLGPAFCYGKVGPSLFLTSVAYGVQGTATDYLGAKPGFQLGLGARYELHLSDAFGFAFRVEASGYRRGYLNDFFFAAGLGLLF
jgi:hypothetical protein